MTLSFSSNGAAANSDARTGSHCPRDDLIDAVNALIFAVQFQIIGKVLGDARQLDILPHDLAVDRKSSDS